LPSWRTAGEKAGTAEGETQGEWKLCPKAETELRKSLDILYQQSKEALATGGCPAFEGLLEIM